MFSPKLLVVFSLIGFTLSVQAGEIGAAHNRYLDCLLKIGPRGAASAEQTLTLLVERCQFKPGMPTSEFARTYARLVPEAVTTPGQDIDLMQVIRGFSGEFNRMHLSYLQKIQSTLQSQQLREASQTLTQLHAQAQRELRQGSKADVAVLAAIDIGASSASYWAGQRNDSDLTLRAKWWQVVLADVAGGVVGGVFGGGVGAVGLGTACSTLVSKL